VPAGTGALMVEFRPVGTLSDLHCVSFIVGAPAGHNDKRSSPALFRETQTLIATAIKRPISAAVAGTGNSSEFRYAVPHVENSCVISESLLSRGRMEKLSSEGGVNPTFFGTRPRVPPDIGGVDFYTNLTFSNRGSECELC
jgi:hypothetical protein